MSYKDEIRALIAGMDEHEGQENEQSPQDHIEDVYVFVVREHDGEEEPVQVVESEPPIQKPHPQPFEYVTLGIVMICCLPLLASIIFQVYLLQNPPIATITIFPK